MTKLRILVAGGGTGGHVYPLVAVVQELRSLAASKNLALDARYFGGADYFSSLLAESDIRFVSIISSKLRSYASVQNFLDAPKFFLGLLQALWKVYWFMPNAVFSKGGPGVLPIVLACKFYMIPIVVHESDSVPGRTNAWSAKLARKVYVAFSAAKAYLGESIEVVGNPVRQELAQYAGVDQQGRNAVKQQLGFDPNLPLLLVIGGSQGATRLNEFILENLEQLVRQFQILHQAGEGNYAAYKNEYAFISKNWSELETRRYQFKPYFDKDLINAYLAADLVLARAGAGTIFELACLGRPAVLVPLPEAAGDHQTKNAYEYANTGAAIVVEQDNLTGHLMINRLSQLISDANALQQMSNAAKSFCRPEAARKIAEGIIQICNI